MRAQAKFHKDAVDAVHLADLPGPSTVPARPGVKILLNIRGICVLRPGVAGVSENIEVRSIVDRFLEHARLFYFRNGGHEEVYLSSADWMRRNLLKRLEIMFPILDATSRSG